MRHSFVMVRLHPVVWISWLLVATMLLVAPSGFKPGVVGAQAAGPTPLPLYFLPDARTNRAVSSSTLALSDNGSILAASNMLNGTVTLVSTLVANQPKVLAEVPVGRDPRGVAMNDDSSILVVANRGDSSLSVINIADQVVTATIDLGGSLPYAVVMDGLQTAYVTLQGSNEVVIVDTAAQQVTQRILVPERPSGLALWGDLIYVTHFWTGDISLIYLPQGRVVDTVHTGADLSASQAVELDITRGLAYLPQTRSNAQNRHLTFDSIVFPVVNVLDLRGMTLQYRSRITLDTADRPVNMPFAAAVDRFRNWLYVANAGSNDISVIDLNTNIARMNIPVGANPRGLILNRDNTFLFAHNVLDGTITTIDTSSLEAVDVLPISSPAVPIDILLGVQFFHSAVDPRLSAEHWVSCANCHFDGQSDGRVWQGFGDGPRNTPLLYNLVETAPYNWSATWDEVVDVELKIRDFQAGTGLIEDFPVADPLGVPHTGLSPDLDTLAIYLNSLHGPANPNRFDAAQIERGKAVFAAQGCDQCHVAQVGTNLQAYEVGTGSPALEKRGLAFDTPSLRYLWLSAPYFHDGSAALLRDVFLLPGAHQLVQQISPQEIDSLTAYLLSWE